MSLARRWVTGALLELLHENFRLLGAQPNGKESFRRVEVTGDYVFLPTDHR